MVLTDRAPCGAVAYAALPTTTTEFGTGVLVVVVVVTALVGVGGGGAETTCDSGADTQPDSNARSPHKAREEESGPIARSGVAIDWIPFNEVFIGTL